VRGSSRQPAGTAADRRSLADVAWGRRPAAQRRQMTHRPTWASVLRSADRSLLGGRFRASRHQRSCTGALGARLRVEGASGRAG
jgi:hypothetical protein